ncbi:trifunctional serine/threonine-protein kinase/ATP-binding protein/sensor histidine kinase [Bradyrhizobium sp. CB2312]|uniref:trifunctional serine/threonine-protein kinase/ATP-binding protein/sensor histidine kinase n=1 Tax=Bradyrhizobium sp. CB2312 TaxID=3039155 RepID=UPI0024B0F88B|nr:trifunctional serine/threonine-protein kinase/ATP-binding protein/sensor histidine kinase [Bradyrhizobium sp. CB2312]WFU73425.1 AAA family ATPase [Bradyrhizobium sp. CB2312]
MSYRSGVSGFGDLELLSKDDGYVIGRARCTEARGGLENVLIVFPNSEASNALGGLAHEYSLKNELDSAWAVRPLELLQDRGQTILVLADPGGELLSRHIGRPMTIERFLRIAIGITAGLGQLHQQHLVHRDIKPANIIVNANDEVWITGFRIASRLPRERQPPDPPEVIAGTLPYMAPEQTGRMNRSVDSRSDLYSLGVTFYEMLTGSLPFTASEPMEWVHSHIARKPEPPNARQETVPSALSAMVMKLLEKRPEERYQTAGGLERDLRRCLADWMRGHLAEFPLGAEDAPDRLLIPEMLYGREREVGKLLSSLDRVMKSGAPEFVLVSGYSGIGKSSIVHELHEALVPRRGLFAAGKFERDKRDIPYAPLAQAFQSLIQSLLSESDAKLSGWRDALIEAFGANGQLIVDFIPELRLIVGDQPPVSELPPQEALKRFQMVFRRFVGVFARQQHPLTLFLDDLQWFDVATLDLIEDILAQRDIGYLLLIGAYRDNEVDAAHPLTRKLAAIRQVGIRVNDIAVGALSDDELGELIADSLHCQPESARPLTLLIQEKTGGNPFFVIEFLKTLADEGLLVFNHAKAQWFWDVDRINAKQYTDNVIDLMVAKLHRLPTETQTVLRDFSCVGFRATVSFLAAVCQTSAENLHANLWEAVRTGMVRRSNDTYAFQHDRIRESIYSLISNDARAEAHLRIGRLLLDYRALESSDEIVFEIISQFNRSLALVTSPAEREQLARLNLVAGKRAKSAAAYLSALTYFTEGRALLEQDCWACQYALAFEFELYRAECELLTGGFSRAEERLSALANRSINLVDRAKVTSLLVDIYIIQARAEHAVEAGLEYLRQVGFDLSPHPADQDVQREYDAIWQRLGARPIESLIDLPPMSDPSMCATIQVMNKLMVSALYQDQKLHQLLLAHMVNLSIEHGNSAASCVGYVGLGRVLAAEFGNPSAALRFGQLGLDLLDKRGMNDFSARVFLVYATGISPWTKHLRVGLSYLSRSASEANKVGDLQYIGLCRSNIVGTLLSSGEPLEEVDRAAVEGLDLVQKAGPGIVAAYILGQLRLIRILRDVPCDFQSFDSEKFDAERFERYLGTDPNLAIAKHLYWSRRMQASVFLEDYASALKAASQSQGLLSVTSPNIERAEYHFYAALARAGSIGTIESTRTEEDMAHTTAITAHHRQLESWARDCPENFETRSALVGAELARIENRKLDAQRLYEQAIRSARANRFLHIEALACETAAHFYAAGGFEDIADMYLQRARNGYVRWGANGKVRQIDERYSHLAVADTRGRKAEITSSDQPLDLAAVIKASRVLSSEILLPRLIEQLMVIALRNAGANRGLLILPAGDTYVIHAEARAVDEQINVTMRQDPIDPMVCPESLIRYVLRTRESVLLDDASKPSLFSEDSYLHDRLSRSVLCFPLIKQQQLAGILLLENTLTSHAFTPARISILELLAAQAAISLENTRLYAEVREREAKVRRLVDSNIIGISIGKADGCVLEANKAFLRIVGYDEADLAAGRLRRAELTPLEWRDRDLRAAAEMRMTGTAQPFEKEYLRKDGSRVPVLVGGATLDERGDTVVNFVLDLTDRKRAEAELAHANRITTMGQLTASLAHEINQPIGAARVNAGTTARWLRQEPLNLEKARQSNDRTIKDVSRLAEIVNRIHDFSRKSPARMEDLEINEVILEITTLAGAAMSEHGVLAKMRLSEGLPRVVGDRVQLQQVVLNLIMNAVEAVSEVEDRPRELLISTDEEGSGGVLLKISDSGPGLPQADPERVFEAFYTTKASGLGMGLPICRSIVEAHGGRLWAIPNEPCGAVFQIALPIGGKSLGNEC